MTLFSTIIIRKSLASHLLFLNTNDVRGNSHRRIPLAQLPSSLAANVEFRVRVDLRVLTFNYCYFVGKWGARIRCLLFCLKFSQIQRQYFPFLCSTRKLGSYRDIVCFAFEISTSFLTFHKL